MGTPISEPVKHTDIAAMRKLADRTKLLSVEDLSLDRAVGCERMIRVIQREMKQTIGNVSDNIVFALLYTVLRSCVLFCAMCLKPAASFANCVYAVRTSQ
jgi:hypothetical protein